MSPNEEGKYKVYMKHQLDILQIYACEYILSYIGLNTIMKREKMQLMNESAQM